MLREEVMREDILRKDRLREDRLGVQGQRAGEGISFVLEGRDF